MTSGTASHQALAKYVSDTISNEVPAIWRLEPRTSQDGGFEFVPRTNGKG